jgi:hypothetical protein
MTLAAPLTPATLRTIRCNAGRMPAAEIAAALGWSLPELERRARDRGIDLRIPPPRDDPPIEQTSAAGHPTNANHPARCHNVSINLRPADYDALVAKAKEHNLKRATLLAALLVGALKAGMFDAMVKIGRKEFGE